MGFVWCPFCKNPHLLTEQTCPITHLPMPTEGGRTKKRSVQIGSLIDKKYVLKTLLGSGGFGVVYAAENVVDGGLFALKFLGNKTRDAALRFEQESRIAHRLQHPNICRVFDSGTTAGGTPFFVMELLAGATLGRRMDQRALDPHEAVGIMVQVLSGLSAAHAMGVIHRDIKPENIFLEEQQGLEPVAKILDFGTAKLRDALLMINTAKGMSVGTILYMSPEQVQGHQVGIQSDIFASAVVLYEAIAGRHPFPGKSHLEVATRILRESPAPLRARVGACSPAFCSVVATALEKDPARRSGSAEQFRDALEAALRTMERPRQVERSAENRLPDLGDSADDEAETLRFPSTDYDKH